MKKTKKTKFIAAYYLEKIVMIFFIWVMAEMIFKILGYSFNMWSLYLFYAFIFMLAIAKYTPGKSKN